MEQNYLVFQSGTIKIRRKQIISCSCDAVITPLNICSVRLYDRPSRVCLQNKCLRQRQNTNVSTAHFRDKKMDRLFFSFVCPVFDSPAPLNFLPTRVLHFRFIQGRAFRVLLWALPLLSTIAWLTLVIYVGGSKSRRQCHRSTKSSSFMAIFESLGKHQTDTTLPQCHIG